MCFGESLLGFVSRDSREIRNASEISKSNDAPHGRRTARRRVPPLARQLQTDLSRWGSEIAEVISRNGADER